MNRRPRLTRSAVAALAVVAVTAGSVMAGATTDDHHHDPVPFKSGPWDSSGPSITSADTPNGSELLRDAPWLDQANGSPTLRDVDARPSLVFPAGTTYGEAITDLYRAVKGEGVLPSNAKLGPSLPKDIVFARSSNRSALSLTAPFGYDIGTGNILSPGLYYPPSMTQEDIEQATRDAFASGSAIPAGAAVAGNVLQPCQVIINSQRTAACS